ncbi:MAG: hypothetical protein A3J52_00430 [Omnitrophica bacterium RIFCSPHIGHO2_02_FULL_49_9]|nr:MAG: hypothetical protein A3J52_00430 [Omnitrophica bacterium RIFCSPHIGHO2_02_FULL_49_9]
MHMTLAHAWLTFVIGLYLAGFVIYVLEFTNSDPSVTSRAGRLIEVGFLFHTLEIFVHTFSGSRAPGSRFLLPVETVGESLSFFAWSLAFVYLVLVKRYRTEGFGLVLSPVLVLFLIPALFPFPERHLAVPHLDDSYFLLHILSAFFAYGSFTLSFIAGLLYLTQDWALKLKAAPDVYRKLPSLEDLERFTFRTIFWGLLLLGVAIVTGGLWTQRAFGTFLLLEPKSFATLLTWCVYLAIMYFHHVSLVKGRRVILMSVLAFALVLFTFIGTGMIKPGLHVGV